MTQRLTVTSADGTELSVARSGSGTPLVLVHGTAGQPQDFAFLVPAFAQQHEVWVYARRGRGGSSDTSPYALEREIEDLHAVLDATGERAHLLGHSFGGALATLSAPKAELRSLILYEPALRVDRVDEEAREHARAAAASGDMDAVLDAFARIAGISGDEMAAIRSVPVAYEGMKESAVHAEREGDALDALDPDTWRSSRIDVPALVFSGGLTSVEIYADRDDLGAVLTDATFETIPGQRHLATVFDAERFARRVLDFTAAVERDA